MKPRKLNLTEIHRLYLVLKNALPKDEEAFFIDQIEQIIQAGEPELMERCIEIMYPKPPKESSPLDFLFLFIKGLQDNDFFEYAHFIKSLNGRH